MARGEDRAEAVAVHKDASIYVVITDDELKCIKSARGRAIRILHFAPPRLESVEKSSPILVREDEILFRFGQIPAVLIRNCTLPLMSSAIPA